MRRLRTIAVFLLVALLAAIPALWAQLSLEKLALHARVNVYHPSWADIFFSTITHAADGWIPVIVSFTLLVVVGWRAFLMVGLSCAVSGLVTQFLKRIVFAGVDRPSMFRDRLGEMGWVDGLDLHAHFSFPSGHSTAAFSMCLALAVVIGRQGWGAVLAFVAVLLGFSRVYLSQHFTQDVFVGAGIGIGTALVFYHILYRGTFSTRAWLDATPFRQNQ